LSLKVFADKENIEIKSTN